MKEGEGPPLLPLASFSGDYVHQQTSLNVVVRHLNTDDSIEQNFQTYKQIAQDEDTTNFISKKKDINSPSNR